MTITPRRASTRTAPARSRRRGTAAATPRHSAAPAAMRPHLAEPDSASTTPRHSAEPDLRADSRTGAARTEVSRAEISRTGPSRAEISRAGLSRAEISRAGVSRAEAEPAGGRRVFRRGCRRAPARRAYLTSALLRCGLYLGPLSVAVAAAGSLSRVAWPVPLATLLLGWTAAQALTSTGVAVARRAGPAAACRLVGSGFAAVAGLWCALVWIAPAALLGPDRGLALVIGLGGLATLATVTAALVTRAEAAIVRWSLPCWALAAATLAGLPTGTLLPAAIVVAAVRAFRPVVVPGLRGRKPRLTRSELRRGGGYLIIGASQAICVGLLWQAGPSGSTAPFWLPLLLAVPILEALIGWHTDQVEAGLDAAESGADFHRHVRGITVITLAGLLPPFAVGVALALAAYQVPALPAMAGTRAEVLALAGGMLLGGVFAITFLLAARTRTAVAATLAAAPPLVTAAYPILPLPAAGPLPNAVAVLAATHLAGLLVVALTAADQRRTT